MVLATCTSISLIDALLIYGQYDCHLIISELEASAGLLITQLIVLAIVLAIVGLAKIIGRFPTQQELAKTLLVLFVTIILLRVVWIDSQMDALFNFQKSIPKSYILLITLWLITLHILMARQYLNRGDKTAGHSTLSNEHLVLATPIAMAMVFVALSETSDRLAFTRWHQPVFMAIGAALLVIVLIPVKKRTYLLGKSAILTMACFGIMLAPLLSEKMHVASSARAEMPAGAPQHVLLLTVDTLRYDALSVYDPSNNSTPAFEEFAKKSVVFDNAYSASGWTIPAMSSILTGVSPMAHQTSFTHALDQRFTTIGETFAAHGYRTGALVNNPVLFPGRYISDQGFHEYQAYPNKRYQNPSYGIGLLWRMLPKKWPHFATTTGMTDLATTWYENNQKDQTFLWLHYFDPHDPYKPPTAFMAQEDSLMGTRDSLKRPPPIKPKKDAHKPPPNLTGSDLELRQEGLSKISEEERQLARKITQTRDYLAEARYVDYEVGRLFDSLKEKGLFDDMLIVFASDHGEEFWEHGNSGHGKTLYNELIHVPFIIKMPGQSGPVKVSENVSTTDIYQTMADVCDLSVDNKQWEGQSLKSIIESTVPKPNATPIISALTMLDTSPQTVIFDGYKLISNMKGEMDELYSIESDPQELNNIVHEQPEIVAQLNAVLDDAFESAKNKRVQFGLEPLTEESIADFSFSSTKSINREEEFSPGQLEALEALGYLDILEKPKKPVE